LPPGKSASERFDLVAVAATEGATPPVPIPSGDTPSPPSTQRFLAWGALGAAGAVLGGALAAQLVNQIDTWHYNDNGQCLVPNRGSRDDQCGQYRWRADTAQTFAFIGYAGAGAFGIASAVL